MWSKPVLPNRRTRRGARAMGGVRCRADSLSAGSRIATLTRRARPHERALQRTEVPDRPDQDEGPTDYEVPGDRAEDAAVG